MSASNGSGNIVGAPVSGRVSVLLPLVFRAPFEYRLPDGMALAPGDYVQVPFGKKRLWGVVWDGWETQPAPEAKLKSVERVAVHLPPMGAPMRRFIDWVAWYTLAPVGMVLKMAMSAPDALEPPAVVPRYRLAAMEGKRTPSRERVAAYLSDATPRTAKEIMDHARVSARVVQDFASAGGLTRETELAAFAPQAAADPVLAGPKLSDEQARATEQLGAKIGAGFSVTLIDGVTGSGKTEVYFDTIARCIEAGGQALVLLPEIALSVQWFQRFARRFGFAPDLWHSQETAAKRRERWRRIASGEARVVVAARSGLFLPCRRLGLIVVDEEHDASFKQEDGVIYQARDMAVARARRESVPLVLVSATPSLETERNAGRGRYARVHLTERHGEAELPRVRAIDMRQETLAPSHWISPTLKKALLHALGQGHQAMLFMNRRGYAPLLLCRACGHRFQCPHCSASLVVHRAPSRLLCHHCGHQAKIPPACPDCKKEGMLAPYGPGVERVAEEVRAFLPQARIGVMTSDSCRVLMGQKPPEPVTPAALITAMIAGEIDVLVGTQMVAKGHHFAKLALVGVIDADMGLAGGDVRANERTYQLLHQLAGRAGRETAKGEVWLQSYMPGHPVIKALLAGDRDRFMALEAQMREEADMPPYGKLASVIVEGEDEAKVAASARQLVAEAPPHAMHPLVLGPAPAPLALLRGQYRYRILVKASLDFPMQEWLPEWLLARKSPAGVRVKIDVDPYSFL